MCCNISFAHFHFMSQIYGYFFFQYDLENGLKSAFALAIAGSDEINVPGALIIHIYLGIVLCICLFEYINLK